VRRGVLVALSGVDCAGKSTQRDLLVEAMRARGWRTLNFYVRPGYTPGLRLFKDMLRGFTRERPTQRNEVSSEPSRFPRRASNLGHPLRRRLWLTAALLDLLWLCCVRIPVARRRGWAVVCNRYFLDCRVDFRVNFPDDRVESWLLFRLLMKYRARPDAGFCLLVSAEESLRRAQRKARFHWEPLEVLEARVRDYAALAPPLGVEILDGTWPTEEIARAIQNRVVVPSGPSGSGSAVVA
jgi:thymidylate kinase